MYRCRAYRSIFERGGFEAAAMMDKILSGQNIVGEKIVVHPSSPDMQKIIIAPAA